MNDQLHPDTIRLNWLEHMARNGGLFLHNGVDMAREKASAPGLGLRPGKMDRSLRQAIDQALPADWGTARTYLLRDAGIPVDSDGNIIEPTDE